MTRQLPKAYLRIDPNIDQVKGDLDRFMRLLCAANRQPFRGRFKSRAVAAMVLGKSRLGACLKDGDLIEEADGTLYVDGWDHWQEGDLTVAERMRALRDRRNSTVTPGVTLTVTETVTSRNGPPKALTSISPNVISSTGEGSGEGPDPVETYYLLTNRFPRGKALDWCKQLGDEYGYQAASEAMAAEWQADDDVTSLLGRAGARLGLAARDAERKERAQELASIAAKRERRKVEAQTPPPTLTPEEVEASILAYRKEIAGGPNDAA